MNYEAFGGLVLLEVNDVTPELLWELHDFLRIGMIVPRGRVEILKNGNGSPRVGAYSGYFTEEQYRLVKDWLESKGVRRK